MNLFYTTNDLYCAKVAASICSVYSNNRGMETLEIYIIGQDLSQKNQARFQALAKSFKRRIHLIDLGDIKKYFPFDFDTQGWAPVVLARLACDKLLPTDIDRILYLDGDTINLRSLSDLWSSDIGDNVLGGCIEATVIKERCRQLQLGPIPYINSGVLLINLEKWRRENWGERIIAYYRDSGGQLFAPDQDAINGALKGKIYFLPPKYNFFNCYWLYNYKFLSKQVAQGYYYSKEVFDESIKHPTIIHYLGEERPWRRGNHHPYKKQYRYYLSHTPWKDEPEDTGWEFYFICWDIFNFVMRPFPALRQHIIDSLIPAFIGWRQKQLKRNKN
ncbi:MAG: glycosyltransferase family 8 protein [Lachnospiraceae bacterium]|nr:glycosyltransferase family 8 protein [Lachnospiraceae bacterium]